jgi:membrane-associated phospholipid phosphatase
MRPPHLLVALVFILGMSVAVSSYNVALFQLVNGSYTSWSDPLWLSLTTMGDGMVVAIILGGFLLKDPRITIAGLSVMIMSSMMVHAVKFAVNLPRPIMIVDPVNIVGPILKWGSFPSGHSAAAFSASFSIMYYSSSKSLRIAALALGILIGVSRVSVGAHFPIDVLGGAVLALVALIIYVYLLGPSLERHVRAEPDMSCGWIRGLLFLELACALGVFLVYSPYMAESPITARSVSMAVLVFLGFRMMRIRAASFGEGEPGNGS